MASTFSIEIVFKRATQIFYPSFSSPILYSNFSTPIFRVNDCVRVHAIECEPSSANRNCNWRATRVVPKGFSATSFREQPNQSKLLNDSAQSGFIEELTKDKFGVHIEDTINVGIVQKGQSITYPIPIWNYNEETTGYTLSNAFIIS